MAVKLSIDDVISFRSSVQWLDSSSGAIFDCFDDQEFKQKFYVAIERFKLMAEKLGSAELTIKA